MIKQNSGICSARPNYGDKHSNSTVNDTLPFILSQPAKRKLN